jgi:hypothetical protein
MSSGLGKAELEFVMSLTAPLFWVIRERDEEYRVRNGSAFFVDAGQGLFGVTADHVLKGLSADRAGHDVVAFQIGDLPFDGAKNAIIASNDLIDIATFRITREELRKLGKTALTGYQRRWPPLPPLQAAFGRIATPRRFAFVRSISSWTRVATSLGFSSRPLPRAIVTMPASARRFSVRETLACLRPARSASSCTD